MNDAQNEPAGQRKRGRPPAAEKSLFIHANTLLDPDDAEWGKAQSGGLSALLRRLLRAERERVEGKPKR